jgi:hypothetical protein
MSSIFDHNDLDDLFGPDDVDTEDFVLSLTFECLFDTPKSMKNGLFTQHVKKYSDLQQLASDVELLFPSGLGAMLKGQTAPTIQWFKSLPTGPTAGFIVYVLVLTKHGCRPKIYIGSGTSARWGGTQRFKDYDRWTLLPSLVKAALEDGYVIAHKGLLAWTPSIPSERLAPKTRLLFLALEATFTYNFWALRTYKADYGMGHMCLWPRSDLEYDGLCTHCCLYEGIHRKFDLSDEQLEDIKAVRYQKYLVGKREWHHKQMAYNYPDYRDYKNEIQIKYRAENPEVLEREYARNRLLHDQVREAQTYYCDTCDTSYGEERSYNDHVKTPIHKRLLTCDRTSPLFCHYCTYPYEDERGFKRHVTSKRHITGVAKAKAAEAEIIMIDSD